MGQPNVHQPEHTLWPLQQEAAASSAGQAVAAAGGPSAQPAALSGLLLQVRAALAGGDDGAAVAAATAAAMASRAGGGLLPLALQQLVRFAAAPGGPQQQEEQQKAATTGVTPEAGVLHAAAAKFAGDGLLLLEDGPAAAALYRQAMVAAAAAAAVGGGGSSGGGDEGLLSARFAREVEADAALGLAQVGRAQALGQRSDGASECSRCSSSDVPGPMPPFLQVSMAEKQWDAAEEHLSASLRAAEAAGGDASPLLAPVLGVLGVVYSRSARVTFGEGMFREAAKLSKLDPAKWVGAAQSRGPAGCCQLRHCRRLAAQPQG
jgi:hypothetical protein